MGQFAEKVIKALTASDGVDEGVYDCLLGAVEAIDGPDERARVSSLTEATDGDFYIPQSPVQILVRVDTIDFDLETDDPWEETMTMPKDEYAQLLSETHAEGTQYTIEVYDPKDENEISEALCDLISDKTGWCLNGLTFEVLG